MGYMKRYVTWTNRGAIHLQNMDGLSYAENVER